MLTRARTQEIRRYGGCTGCGGKFFSVSRIHHLCSACGNTLAPAQKRPDYMAEVMRANGFAVARDDDVMSFVTSSTTASLTILRLMHVMSRAKIMYSAAEITRLRARIHAAIVLWAKPHYTVIIDAMLLACCYEPHLVGRVMSSTAVCYFGNAGERIGTYDQARRHCRVYLLAASGYGPFATDDLWKFGASMYA